MNIHCIIVAAGSGQRFRAERPKQFCLIDDKPVLFHTIEALKHAVPDGVVSLVLSAEGRDLWLDLCRQHHFSSPRIVLGGNSRFLSVRNAIEDLRPTLAPDDIVMVHDGARPIVDADMVARLINSAAINGAAIPVIPVTSSLRRLEAPGRLDTSAAIDRSLFVEVQTPQTFSARVIVDAYDKAASDINTSFTDDASVVEHAGISVFLESGSPRNIKITYPDDIAIARAILDNYPH